MAVRCWTVRSSSRLRASSSSVCISRRRMSRASKAPTSTTSTRLRKLAAPSSTREVCRSRSELLRAAASRSGFRVVQLPQLVAEVRHRALADVGVHQLERRVPVDLAIEAERHLHLADFLAGERAQRLRLLGVLGEAGFAQFHDDSVEHRIQRAHGRIEVAQVARVFGQQEPALGGLGIEHQSQIARHERLALLGCGDDLAGLVDALVTGLRDDEEGRNERGPEQDRGIGERTSFRVCHGRQFNGNPVLWGGWGDGYVGIVLQAS